jgi:hypothetical protein
MSKDVGPTDPSILGSVYPRSLLYLVSGICEYFEGRGRSGPHAFDGDDMPILGMDRFYAQTAVFPPGEYPSVGQVVSQFAVAPPTAPTKFVRVLSLRTDAERWVPGQLPRSMAISPGTERRWTASEFASNRVYSGSSAPELRF